MKMSEMAARAKDARKSSQSLVQRGMGLTQELGKWAMAGFEVVDSDSRIAICKTCDKYVNGVCSMCGCFVAIKSKLGSASCPIGKW